MTERSDDLTQRPVAELIPNEFVDWFPFETFTAIQSKVITSILNNDDNVLLCAPTGAGKTAIADTAILKLLNGSMEPGVKAVYLSPMRALTYEKARNWENRTGISSVAFTGEESPRTISELNAYDLIISTPEKFDSASRKWRRSEYEFVSNVRLLILDEVHLLDSDGRGDALEALVSRMCRIAKEREFSLRIIAMSATIPNVADVAKWLGVQAENTFVFGDAERPVPLHYSVQGVPYQRNWTQTREVKNDKVVSILNNQLEKTDSCQALVFVNSRKETERLATFLLETWDGQRDQPAHFGHFATDEAYEYSTQVDSAELQNLMSAGVAFHHAGLSKHDRKIVEETFLEGHVRVLCATTTLAWGVNLPARVVIIRDTSLYDFRANEWKLMSASDLKQMIGRAGRPGYDPVGYAFVITPDYEKGDIEYLLRHGKKLSSKFLEVSTEHLLAEIVDGAVKSCQEGVEWLQGTFHAVLLRDHCRSLAQELAKQVEVDVEYLERVGLIKSEGPDLKASQWGEITSYYYLSVGTAEWFVCALKKIQTEGRDLNFTTITEVLAEAMEFSDLILRRAEERFVWSVQDLFPTFRKLSPPAQKVCYVLYCFFTGERLPKVLVSEGFLIRENALRLLAALSEFCEEVLECCPWSLRKAQYSLRYRKAVDMSQIANKQDGAVEIQFHPEPECLEVGQAQTITTVVKNVSFVPIDAQISVVLDGALLLETEVELKEAIWKFPYPLVSENPGKLVYTVEVAPVKDDSPLDEAVIRSLELEVCQ